VEVEIELENANLICIYVKGKRDEIDVLKRGKTLRESLGPK